jgi:hypothetical protein
MLRGDGSFRVSFTITRGQGVLGELLTKGSGFVRCGDLLHPSRTIKLKSPIRIEPNKWYCINVIIEIHEYEMYMTSSSGTDGIPTVRTDSGVVIEYRQGLESCSRTNIDSGQIAGISYFRLDPAEEAHLLRAVPCEAPDSEVIVNSSQDVSVGNSVPLLPDMEYKSSQVNTSSGPDTSSQGSKTPVMDDLTKTNISIHSHLSKKSLPPAAGVIAPPMRTQEILRHHRASSN